jgi:hypothetical protein
MICLPPTLINQEHAMKFKRWIAIGIVNALLISGAIQIFGGNKAAAQTHIDNATNLDFTPSAFIYLPLVKMDYQITPTATPTITPTFTPSPSPSPSFTPSQTFTPSPSPTASPSPTPSPTFDGTPPAICEKHNLPNRTDSFSSSSGPVTYILSKIQNTNPMRVSIVRASAKLSSSTCRISQQVFINNNLVATWYENAKITYAIYPEQMYTNFNVHKNDTVTYVVSSAAFDCSGSITGDPLHNYVEVCGDEIP